MTTIRGILMLILSAALLTTAFALSGCMAAAYQSRDRLCQQHADDLPELAAACVREPVVWLDVCMNAAQVTTEAELMKDLQTVCDLAAQEGI